MTRYRPIRSPDQLPEEGGRIPEDNALDFKRPPDQFDPEELAKDVAMFANQLGGTILVGAVEHGGTLARYLPIEEERAAQIADAYEHAVLERCSPRVQKEIARVPYGDGVVLAVNVPPHVSGVVGVLADRPKPNDADTRTRKAKKQRSAWLFPIRVGNQCEWITPEELAMHMDPQLRRALVLLDQIPGSANVAIAYIREDGGRVQAGMHKIVEADAETNTLRCLVLSTDRRIPAHYPLDQIVTVFVQPNGDWQITLRHF